MNMKPVFSFSIDMKLSNATVGKYDSIHSSLTAITQGNKVGSYQVIYQFVN